MAESRLTDALLDSSLPLATTSPALPSTANRSQPHPPILHPAAFTGAGTNAACDLHGPDTTIQVQGSGWKPIVCVVLVELFKTGNILLGKVVVDGGMFVFSLLCYRSILGAVFILPFALLLESGKWKELDKHAIWWLFINAFVGYSLPMALYYNGLHDTTASYGVIFSSLTPLFTFVLSILLGMEKLRLKSKEGRAKVVGALICFGGALLISLYNGKELHLWTSVRKGIIKNSNGVVGGHHHLRGTLLLLGECICYAFSYPVLVKVLKVYPWKHWSSVLTCVLGGLQTCAIGTIIRRDKLAWKVGWNIQLITIVYSAALGTSAKYWLNLYAVEKRGPVFPPMFNTLSVIFTMVLGALLLGESLTVGSLLGSALVFSGLYTYLYGKAKELQVKMTSGSSNEKLHVQPTHDPKCEDPSSGP
ncbi:WAT1-related protein At5g64700-like [Hordeum vulgare subsp. vulgare]|uniref:EamA domain-containing protein n=1 Tax=Hordeum vulgare subsp. vulgare TaxID=112509 RepID=A0A8I6WV13_HORVV|nr:WAT1-related protein At5g64700-like [Hordeum vulgare subsp. vulgare]